MFLIRKMLSNSNINERSNHIQTTHSSKPSSRIAFLDGLRFVAILTVVLFHYYHSLPSNTEVSYGKIIGEFFLFKYGWLGVMLFFAISGFVITSTLYNSNKLSFFIGKRFSRLFPAMLICSVLTYLVSFFPPQTYQAQFTSFLPSLTFLDPKIFNFIFRTEKFEYMDGVYWSLFTEVRFYIMVSAVYFFNKKRFHINFLALSLVIGIMFPIAIFFQLNQIRSGLNFLFIANQLPWFVFGIGCYYLHVSQNRKALFYALVSFISLSLYIISFNEKPYTQFNGKATFIGMIVIFLLFLSAIKIHAVKYILSFKPFVAIGVSSYSLYLLHQQIGQKFIKIIDSNISSNSILQNFSSIIPCLVLFILIIFSLVLYRLYENPLNKKLNLFLSRKMS